MRTSRDLFASPQQRLKQWYLLLTVPLMADSKSLVLTMPDEMKASYDAMVAKSEPGPDFATHMAFIQGTLRASEQNAMAAEHALAVSSESPLDSVLSDSSRAWLKIFEEKQQEEQRALAQQKGTNQEKRQG